MYLDRILYPVTALGPGRRIAIWVAGCNRRCTKCANPELWVRHPEQLIDADRIADQISSIAVQGVDGLTITGGEPFDQANEICELIDKTALKADVLVFSGYKMEELEKDPEKARLLHKIDVLVDGQYIDELNDGKSALRGSTNQRIVFINDEVKGRYEEYISKGRQIQNFVYDYKTLSVGIHNL